MEAGSGRQATGNAGTFAGARAATHAERSAAAARSHGNEHRERTIANGAVDTAKRREISAPAAARRSGG